jgi:hypothetical protein
MLRFTLEKNEEDHHLNGFYKVDSGVKSNSSDWE